MSIPCVVERRRRAPAEGATIIDTPSYTAPTYTAPTYVAPTPVAAPTYTAPVDTPASPPVAYPTYTAPSAPTYTPPAPTAPTCVPSGTYLSIVFQQTATAADIVTFLNTYGLTMAEGPSQDGTFRARVNSGSTSDEMLNSMRGQTKRREFSLELSTNERQEALRERWHSSPPPFVRYIVDAAKEGRAAR